MKTTTADYARCISSELDAITVMKNVPLAMIQSLLRRIGVDYVEGLPKEAYLMAWLDEFCDNREWLIRIFPESYLYFLLEIWKSKEIKMDDMRWEMVQYLKTFGFLTYKKGNKMNGESNEIYIVEAMKKNFYFFLNSKESKKLMVKYDRWDTIFTGLTYYYGMISMVDMHEQFCRCLGEKVPYEVFLSFIKCRADIWGLGDFLQDSKETEYFKNNNVEEPEITYLFLTQHESLNYREISYEDLKYIKEGYGVDNRWAGLSDLGNYLVEEAGISYYRASVLVHTMMTSIQNSKEYDTIKAGFDTISFEHEDQRRKAEDYLKILYEHVPVYEYKGYSRAEYARLHHDYERRKRRERFTLLPGGNYRV